VECKYFPIIQRVGTSYVCTKLVALLSFFDYNLQESVNGALYAFFISHTKLKLVFHSCVRCSLSGPCVWKKKPLRNFVLRHPFASSCFILSFCLLNVVASLAV